MDPRLARRLPEPADDSLDILGAVDTVGITLPGGGATDATAGADRQETPVAIAAFRDDLERIRFSPYFSRLAAVTQVISQGAAGQVVHNRLTHTIKVTAVARAIATALRSGPDARAGRRSSAAATRWWCRRRPARTTSATRRSATSASGSWTGSRGPRFGLADGFEGNAQTFRIMTELDVHGEHGEGLNLTAAVRAAVLKYPWARLHLPDPHPSDPAAAAARRRQRCGGAGFGQVLRLRAGRRGDAGRAGRLPGDRPAAADRRVLGHGHRRRHRLLPARSRRLPPGGRAAARGGGRGVPHLDPAAGRVRQSADTARSRFTAAGFGSDRPAARRSPGAAAPAAAAPGTAGSSTTRPSGSPSAASPPTWSTVCWPSRSTPRSPPNARSAPSPTAGSPTCEASVEVIADPPVRAGHVVLGRQAWHEVAVLKFVHQRFVLDRPDLAMFQRGQAEALTSLVANLESWLTDPVDAGAGAPPADRPRRAGNRRVPAGRDRASPELLVGPTGESATLQGRRRPARPRSRHHRLRRLADRRPGRASARTLAGFTGQLWDAGSGL